MKISFNDTDKNSIINSDTLDRVIREVREELDSQMEADILERFSTEESLAEARFSDFTLYIMPPQFEKVGEIYFIKEQYKFDWPSNSHLTIEDEIWENLNAL